MSSLWDTLDRPKWRKPGVQNRNIKTFTCLQGNKKVIWHKICQGSINNFAFAAVGKKRYTNQYRIHFVYLDDTSNLLIMSQLYLQLITASPILFLKFRNQI